MGYLFSIVITVFVISFMVENDAGVFETIGAAAIALVGGYFLGEAFRNKFREWKCKNCGYLGGGWDFKGGKCPSCGSSSCGSSS